MKSMTSEFYNHELVAKIIEDYCEAHKINESDFANVLGIHPTHLSRIKGGLMCSPPLLQKIAALGKVKPSELILGVPQKIKQELIENGQINNIPVLV